MSKFLANPELEPFLRSMCPIKALLENYNSLEKRLGDVKAELKARESAIKRTEHNPNHPRLEQRKQEREALQRDLENLTQLMSALDSALNQLPKENNAMLRRHYISQDPNWILSAQQEKKRARSTVYKHEAIIMHDLWRDLTS